MSLTRNLNFANGQVAATPTAIASTQVPDNGQWINAMFSNVGGQSETLVITLAPQGGTQRRVFRAVLDVNEALSITGLPMSSGDVLYATTTDAASVDYILSVAPDGTLIKVLVFNEDGIPKLTTTGLNDILAYS